MPETEWFTKLENLTFPEIRKQLKAWAKEAGEVLSNNQAKHIAGLVSDAVACGDVKRIVYADPTGESVARRWFQFLAKKENKK